MAPQQARKSARGKRLSPSLAIINAALPDSPLPKKRRTDHGETDTHKENTPTVSKTIPRSRKTERSSTRHSSLSNSVSSLRVSPDPTPNSGACKGEISDREYQSIVKLFATRYIKTFDKDHLALEDAYISEATFSCRFISGSRSPSPYYFTKCNTGTLQGRSSIIQALSSFSRRIVFVPPTGPALDVTIDILRLPDMNYFTTLTFNTIIEGAGVLVEMVFLLKESIRLTGKQDPLRVPWAPYVVMSHQIILRS